MKAVISNSQNGEFTDIKIKCVDCGKKFVFSANEQKFFKKQGWNAPIRCKNCRKARAKGKKYIGLSNITGKMGAQKSVLFDHVETYGPSHCVNSSFDYSSDNYDDEK